MRSNSPRLTRRAATAAIATVGIALLSGCSSDAASRGFLPGFDDGQVTNQTERITNLWVGSWQILLVVGLIVWGLMLWCITVYRKRRDDNQLPVQTRYHMPLEIMYTVLPMIMVLSFFYFTDRDMTEIQDTSKTPDLTIQAIGKQWSWDFNYLDSDVYSVGQQESDPSSLGEDDRIDGAPGTSEALPTLYLPVDQRVEFELQSRDVIHSFWVPAFLYKLDMIPGRTNTFQIIPEREGVYAGKCAELCGEFHSGMLFNVAVVSEAEFDQHMDELRELGQTGSIPVEGFSRAQSEPTDDAIAEGEDN